MVNIHDLNVNNNVSVNESLIFKTKSDEDNYYYINEINNNYLYSKKEKVPSSDTGPIIIGFNNYNYKINIQTGEAFFLKSIEIGEKPFYTPPIYSEITYAHIDKENLSIHNIKSDYLTTSHLTSNNITTFNINGDLIENLPDQVSTLDIKANKITIQEELNDDDTLNSISPISLILDNGIATFNNTLKISSINESNNETIETIITATNITTNELKGNISTDYFTQGSNRLILDGGKSK